jgi:DNA-binding beta-propeller fold protein YncE
VFVTNYGSNRVQELTLAGGYVRSFGGTGSGAGQIREPDGIGIGPSGNVFVSDSMNQRVDVFSPTGTFTQAFGWGVNTGSLTLETCTSTCRAGATGSGAGQLWYPAGLTVDASGRVLVSDNFGGRDRVGRVRAVHRQRRGRRRADPRRRGARRGRCGPRDRG